MAITINSNVAALLATRRLSSAGRTVSQSFERLSSGMRITRPADDAAGLAVAADLNTSSKVFARGILNGNDGLGVLSVAEGALRELSSMLTRMRELASQAANGTLSNAQRRSLDAEAQALRNEYNRILETTKFNGVSLFGSESRTTSIQLGYGSEASISIAIGKSLARSSGTGEFKGVQPIGGGASMGVTVGDFNGDGHADASMVNGTDSVSLALGAGDGTFSSTQNSLIPMGLATTVAAADLNGDGADEIVVGSNDGNVMFYDVSSGTPSLYDTYTFDMGGRAITALFLEDMNGDGTLDLIAAGGNDGDGGVYISLSKGGGAFTPSIAAGPNRNVTDLAIGDFNGDGRLDFAAVGAGSSDITVSINAGNGQSFKDENISGLGLNQEIAAGDTNGDGVDEIIIAKDSKVQISGPLDAKDVGATSRKYEVGNLVGDVLVEDLNGDGFDDIIVPGFNSVSTLMGTAKGPESTAKVSTTTVKNNPAAFGDFNGDGVGDLLLGTGTGASAVLGEQAQSTTLEAFSLVTAGDAKAAFGVIDDARTRVSQELGAVGAGMSRVRSALNSLTQTLEDYRASQSRIEDVDTATETAQVLRGKILQESGAAILAQANLLPSLALRLLEV